MGTDLIPTLHEWDDGLEFIQNHSFVIQQRQGYAMENIEEHPNYPKNSQTMTNETIGMMSSTEVRKRVRNGTRTSIHGHVTPNTIKYLIENNLYI